MYLQKGIRRNKNKNILLEDLREGDGASKRKTSGSSARKQHMSINRKESGQGVITEERLLGIIASLKKATSLFAASLNVPESHKIHVKGAKTLFSYYKLGVSGSILAVYTALKPSSGDPATDDSASVADVDIRMEDVDKDMRKIQDKLQELLASMLS